MPAPTSLRHRLCMCVCVSVCLYACAVPCVRLRAGASVCMRACGPIARNEARIIILVRIEVVFEATKNIDGRGSEEEGDIGDVKVVVSATCR